MFEITCDQVVRRAGNRAFEDAIVGVIIGDHGYRARGVTSTALFTSSATASANCASVHLNLRTATRVDYAMMNSDNTG